MDNSPHKSDFVTVNGIRLHYLDWGGSGPVLLFVTGLGLSAHIYDKFAPRFTDRFHVIAATRRGQGDSDYPASGYDVDTLTEDLRQFMDALKIDRAILVGHSFANIELCHFSSLHPERILKLIFLDANYDRTSTAFKTMMAANPLKTIPIPGLDVAYYNIEDYTASIKRAYPSLAVIWDEALNEDLLHSITQDAEGKIIDRVSAEISQALNTTLKTYKPEDTKIQAPVLSIFALDTPEYYLSSDYMTPEQQAQVIEYFDKIRNPAQRENIEQFRRDVPHARIVEIPNGHHYCFMKHAEIVFNEMSKFLVE